MGHATDAAGAGDAAGGTPPPRRLRRFAAAVLRGQGQVTFLPSAAAGGVFCLALTAAGWEYGLYGLAGAATGTATAWLLGVDRDRVSLGLDGFNACLTALGLAVVLGPGHLSTALVALAACAVVTVVTTAAGNLLGPLGLPPLTLPFCLTASAAAVAAPGLRRVWHHGDALAALPRPASGPTAIGPAGVARGFLSGFAEIFLMPQWYVGALLLLGLLVASRRAAAVACLGNAAGMAAAWALGVPAAGIADGTAGYNAVLVALALCGTFLPARAATLAYALAGAAVATAAGPAVAALVAPSGGHVFTWPFVLTTLVFLAAARSFPRLTG
ncbi:Urea transporter [Streptomyces alboniger]